MKAPARIRSGEGTCRDVLKCIFGLGEIEIMIYRQLLRSGPSRIESLQPSISRDKSTVYRALQRLVKAGLVDRETKNLKGGGQFHEYIAVPPEEIRQRVYACMDDWIDNLRSAFEKFDIV
jgi:predicted transcriptional regulator